MRLKKIILHNIAPFTEDLVLDFDDENVAVLSGINGAGKTTILSYIIDAFYELAKHAFFNEFEDRQHKFYRISSALYSVDMSKPSVVYLRFIESQNAYVDYVNITGQISEEEYSEIQIENPITFSLIKRELKNKSLIKRWSLTESKKIKEVFSNNILTYFPSYRYEIPHYLNEPYKTEPKFDTAMSYAGYLINPIEIISDLTQIAGWIMDIVLDGRIGEPSSVAVSEELKMLLSNMLSPKLGFDVYPGIGYRNAGVTRIAIADKESKVVYPSIFSMSSGELALLCLFGEIIRQSDKLSKPIDQIHGIVLVDEIDKHLHITLQKKTLPDLIEIFPNIQFIVSSHSPFLGLGLEEKNTLSCTIFDLDNNGCSCPHYDNEIFREAYETMLKERETFSAMYKQLQKQIHESSRPIVITEGKSDWKHLKAAMKALNITDIDICFLEFSDEFGDESLCTMLKNFSRVPNTRKIIGMFDRDDFDKLKKCSKSLAELCNRRHIELGNNVYAFAIPLVHEELYGSHISIEHYYIREQLIKTTPEGRRLFLGDEFFDSGNSVDRTKPYRTKCSNIKRKVKINAVIDEKVYYDSDPQEEHSLALPKDKFAQMILDEDVFARDFDFSSFTKIFDVLREICQS